MHANIPPGPPGVLSNGYPQQGPPGHCYPQNPQMMPHHGAPRNQMPMNPQNMQNGMYMTAGPVPYRGGPPLGAPVPPPNANVMQWVNAEYPSYSNSPAPSYAPSVMSHMSHNSNMDDRFSTMSMHSEMRINDGRPSSQISCSENTDPRKLQEIMNLSELLANFQNPALRPTVILSLDVACREAKTKHITLPCAQLLPLLQHALETFSFKDIGKMTRSFIYFIEKANKQELIHAITITRDRGEKNFVILLAKNSVKTLELIYAFWRVLNLGEDILVMARHMAVLDSLMTKLLAIDPSNIHYYHYALKCVSILMRDKASKIKPYVLNWTQKDGTTREITGLIDIICKGIFPTVTKLHPCQSLPETSKSPTSVGIDVLDDTYLLLGYFLAPTEKTEKEVAADAASRILQNGGLTIVIKSIVWYGHQLAAEKKIPIRIIKLLFNIASYGEFLPCVSQIDDNTTREITNMLVFLLHRCTIPRQPPHQFDIIIPCWRYLLAFLYRFTLNNERNKKFFSEQRGFPWLGSALNKCAAEIGHLREKMRNAQSQEIIRMERKNLNETLENALIIMMNLLFLKSIPEEIMRERNAICSEFNFLEAILRIYDGKIDGMIDYTSVVKRLPRLIVQLIEATPRFQTKEFLFMSLYQVAEMTRTPPNMLNRHLNLVQILLQETKEQLEFLFRPTSQQENEKKKSEFEVVRNLRCLMTLFRASECGFPDITPGIVHFARETQIHCYFLRFIDRKQEEDIDFCRGLLNFGNEICSNDPQLAQVWLSESNTLEQLVNSADAGIAKYAQKILDKLHVGDSDPMAANLAYGFGHYS